MTPDEAKTILSVYRYGSEDGSNPFFAEALKLASEDADLARWFAAERAFDAAIAGKLTSDSVPPGLKDALLAAVEPRNTFEWTWPRAACLAAAAAGVTLLLALNLFPAREKGDSVENYRAEMVNFVSLDPPLEMETGDMRKVEDQLARNDVAAHLDVPGGVQKLPVLGCRSLLFRGYKVGLICFRRNGDQLAHLLVVDRAAFAGAKLPAQPDFHQEGEWMTATWTEGGKLYVLAVKGGRKDLETLLAASGPASPWDA